MFSDLILNFAISQTLNIEAFSINSISEFSGRGNYCVICYCTMIVFLYNFLTC